LTYSDYRYTKVPGCRKHAIRGLWRRNGKSFAWITVEDDAGRKAVKWVYGHLSNEHAQAQAARMNFGPAITPLTQVASA
jgi:hypothetical protein